MSTNSWCVYVHILKENPKKIYVGITGRKPEVRWNNGAGYTKGHFCYAIRKFGFDAFEHIVLMKSLSKEVAEAVEVELIRSLPLQGYHLYNICSGGSVSDGRKGKHNTIEHNMKISQANKGKKQSKTQIEASRQRLLAKKSGWFSNPNAKSPFCNLSGKLNCRAHKVYVFDLNGNYLDCFDTIREASKVYGVAEQYISTCCRGRIHKTHGYRFSYTEVCDYVS